MPQQDPILNSNNKRYAIKNNALTTHKGRSDSELYTERMNVNSQDQGEWTTVTNRKKQNRKATPDKDKKMNKDKSKSSKSPRNQPGQLTISQFIGDTTRKHKDNNADTTGVSALSTTKCLTVVTPTRTKSKRENQGSPVRKGLSYSQASQGIMKETNY